MSSLRKLKRGLDSYRVAVATVTSRRRKEKGYDHFQNRRSTKVVPKEEPMPEPSILPLVKEEETK